MNFRVEIPLNCIDNEIWLVSMNLYLKIHHTQLDKRKTESSVGVVLVQY